MVSGDLLINTAVSKLSKIISLDSHRVTATNKLPLKAGHWECYLLVLQVQIKCQHFYYQ